MTTPTPPHAHTPSPASTAGDPRSVEELIRDADILARTMLWDHDADHHARLHTFPEVIEAAVELWHTIPSRTPDPRLDHAHAATTAIHRSIAADKTRPAIPDPDPAMAQITANLTRATELINARRLPGIDLTPAGQHHAEGARVRILHLLHLTTHAALNAARSHVDDLTTRGQRTSAPLIHARQSATTTRDRIASLEYDLALQLDMQWPGILTTQTPITPPEPLRLDTAINRWDIHAHRALAASPTLPTLTAISAAHRDLTLLTTLITTAAAETGHLNPDQYRHTQPALDHLHTTWSTLHTHLRHYLGTNRRIDPQLQLASAELRAATRHITHDHTSLATPATIIERIDLPHTTTSLHRAGNIGLNLAYLTHEALHHNTITVAARPAHHRAMTSNAPIPPHGWVDPRALQHNRDIPMPPPVRDDFLTLTTNIINAARAAETTTHTPAPDRTTPRTHARHQPPEPTDLARMTNQHTHTPGITR